jgi:hypothetical protein
LEDGSEVKEHYKTAVSAAAVKLVRILTKLERNEFGGKGRKTSDC